MKKLYLTRREAAKYVRENFGLPCSEKWLAKLVVTGGGPQFYKDGRSVRYRTYDLDAWVARRVNGPFNSSSELAAPMESELYSEIPIEDV